jgi:PPM family protein phosphatase
VRLDEETNTENDSLSFPSIDSLLDLTDGYESARADVEIASMTHPGLVRKKNEDHYLAVRFSRSFQTLFTNIDDSIFKRSSEEVGFGTLVADGIGGMAAGEIASRMAICKLVEFVLETPDWIMKLTDRDDINVVQQRAIQRFRRIDEALKKAGQSNVSLHGMGTTLTVSVSLGRAMIVAHVGDSRAYLVRDERIHQLTNDHTLAQALVDAGIAKPEDVATRALRHVLTAALGSASGKPDPQIQRLDLQDGDQILLCTDGLSEMVQDDVIASVLRDSPSAETACQALTDLALSGGGLDNITMVLTRYRFPTS